MAKTYEHEFRDLHADPAEIASSVVELGPEQPADQTGARINKAPGNPDAGKPDQFGDLASAPVPDEGIDVGLPEDEVADEVITEVATGGEEADDDLKDLSKSARERIMRERRLRQESEERGRRLEAELAQVNQKIDLQGKEQEWRTADETDDKQLGSLKGDKAKALEEGRTSDVVDLDDKITDIKAAKKARDAERIKAREDAKKRPAPPKNDKAQAWIDAHPDYQRDPLFREAANAADRLLYAQGFNATTDEYYRKLSSIMAEGGKFKIDPKYLGTKSVPRNGPRGGGSQGIRGGTGDVRKGSQGRVTVTVTAADKVLLAQMGQDPDDPGVIRAFAKEKLAQARADAAARNQ
jgi:hypothetical protein